MVRVIEAKLTQPFLKIIGLGDQREFFASRTNLVSAGSSVWQPAVAFLPLVFGDSKMREFASWLQEDVDIGQQM